MASAINAVYDAIRTHANATIEASVGGTPVVQDNFGKGKPTDNNTLWARVAIRTGSALVADFGSPTQQRHRSTGVLFISLFTPSEQGTKAAEDMVEDLLDAFRSTTLGAPTNPVTFRSPTPRTIGLTEGGFFQHNVECPFWFDELST